MKTHKSLLVAAVLFAAIPVFVAGCKYKVTEPMWNQPYTTPPAPTITSVDPPSEAKPGINTITIHGHNLVVTVPDTTTPENTVVYFGTTQTDVISADSTTVVVYRPSVPTIDTLKVVPHNASGEALYGPYKVDSVAVQYGGFLQNLVLSAIAVDNSANLYVTETVSHNINLSTPDGNNTVAGVASLPPTGMAIGPSGNLYIAENNRYLDSMDVTTHAVGRWTQMPPGKVPLVGDFGPGGYFYVGGVRTDLCVIPPNPPARLSATQIRLAGSYLKDEITAICVNGGHVYVASKVFGVADSTQIWRSKINGDNVDARELVADLSSSRYASAPVTGIAFSSTGTMIISTNSQNPLLVVNASTGQVVPFYKGILPPYCSGIAWSKTSNYLYMISGNTGAGQTWTVYRVDMGQTGGANF